MAVVSTNAPTTIPPQQRRSGRWVVLAVLLVLVVMAVGLFMVLRPGSLPGATGITGRAPSLAELESNANTGVAWVGPCQDGVLSAVLAADAVGNVDLFVVPPGASVSVNGLTNSSGALSGTTSGNKVPAIPSGTSIRFTLDGDRLLAYLKGATSPSYEFHKSASANARVC